jgi:hypothetical protein
VKPLPCATEGTAGLSRILAGLSRILAQKHAKTTPLGKLSDIIGNAPLFDPAQIGACAKKLNPLREGPSTHFRS